MKVAPLIQNLKPYVAGKPIEETKREYGLTEVIKLASNENPLGPSSKVLAALRAALPEIHRYPDAGCVQVKARMSQHLGFSPEWLAFGNGSDEMIDLLLRVYCSEGGRALMFEKSFAAYKIAAHATNVEVDEVRLRAQFEMHLDDLFAQFDPLQHRLIFVVNPNNPTGRHIPLQQVENLLQKLKSAPDTLLVLDEAYFEFVDDFEAHDSLRILRDYPHLIVLRTMSKAYGLAGLRFGTMIAHPHVVELINKTRKPFNVNSLAQVATLAALEDQDYVVRTVELTRQGRSYFQRELTALGLRPVPSQANFVLFETQALARDVNEALLKKGIILRPLQNYGLPHHLRLSVGTETENRVAIAALKEVIASRDS